MSPAPSLPPVDLFRGAIAARLGLRFDEDKAELLARVLDERVEARGGSLAAYLARLSDGDADEIAALAERLTIGETYFFRNAHDIDAFTRTVLPERIRARGGERRLRILSAGCSSGEEPYTIAMLVLQTPQLARWDVRIQGVDVNPAAVARARGARYSAWSLRQTPPDARVRFFRPEGQDFRVVEDVTALVAIEERNLVADDAELWAPATFDVVFCRNVLMYLAPEVVRRIVARLAKALVPGGFLFLGHAETLRGVSSEFHLRQTQGSFYYQSRTPDEASEPTARAGRVEAPRPPPPPSAATDAGWITAIRDASQRIADLTRAGAANVEAAPPSGSPPEGGAPGAVAAAHALLVRERYLDALAALGPTPPEQEKDVDALLLRAVLLASSGDVRAAEAVCARVLRLDELNAEAHYLRALCRDHAGDPAAAADHDRYALHLDPTFAMPRLHLGLVAKRAGDLDEAQRELSRALVLFAAEDGSRILLLGAGFTRDALLSLCRAELDACGGRT